MKRPSLITLIASALLASGMCFSAAPINLFQVKQQLIQYHDSGNYSKDISAVVADAMKYLDVRADKRQQKLAIVLDIDETALSNYPHMKRLDFGGTLAEIRADEDKGEDKAIAPTLALYQAAKAKNVAVFFVTGRYEEERQPTVANLEKAGFHQWDGLVLRDGKYRHMSAVAYKTAARKKIAEQGYDIIMSIGDQDSDLKGGYADNTFKLPNPYYFIP